MLLFSTPTLNYVNESLCDSMIVYHECIQNLQIIQQTHYPITSNNGRFRIQAGEGRERRTLFVLRKRVPTSSQITQATIHFVTLIPKTNKERHMTMIFATLSWLPSHPTVTLTDATSVSKQISSHVLNFLVLKGINNSLLIKLKSYF